MEPFRTAGARFSHQVIFLIHKHHFNSVECTDCRYNSNRPAIERVQALADILRSALYAFAMYKDISLQRVCCHSNETRTPIANLHNSALLKGTLTIPPSYMRVCAVVREFSEGQTDTQTHRRPWPIYISPHRVRVRYVVVKQLLGLPRFQNLLVIVYDHIITICAIIRRLFGQNKLITRFDGRRYIDD